MKFLIQSSIFDTSEKTVQYLQNNGHKVREFSEKFSIKDEHFFRGSLEVAQEVEDNENIDLFFDSNLYDFTSFANKFPYGFLNEDFEVFAREEFINSREEILQKFGKKDFITGSEERIVFVRPNSGLKSFTGQVIDETFWNAYGNMFRRRGVEEIVVSSAKNVGNEFRFVVFYDDLVKAGSYYIKDGEVKYEKVKLTHPAYRFAKRIAEDNSFEANNNEGCYILDIVNADGEYNAVEINAFSTSDLYHCDRNSIFKRLTFGHE